MCVCVPSILRVMKILLASSGVALFLVLGAVTVFGQNPPVDMSSCFCDGSIVTDGGEACRALGGVYACAMMAPTSNVERQLPCPKPNLKPVVVVPQPTTMDRATCIKSGGIPGDCDTCTLKKSSASNNKALGSWSTAPYCGCPLVNGRPEGSCLAVRC